MRTTFVVSRMWASMAEFVGHAPAVLLFGPLLLLPLTAAASLTAGAAVGGIVFYGLLGVVLALAWLSWLLVVGLLRGADLGIRLLRGAKATCHHAGCNYRSAEAKTRSLVFDFRRVATAFRFEVSGRSFRTYASNIHAVCKCERASARAFSI